MTGKMCRIFLIKILEIDLRSWQISIEARSGACFRNIKLILREHARVRISTEVR